MWNRAATRTALYTSAPLSASGPSEIDSHGHRLFNLPAKRIVQIDNTYEPLAPAGELHYHNGRFLSRKVVVYRLPAGWSIVP